MLPDISFKMDGFAAARFHRYVSRRQSRLKEEFVSNYEKVLESISEFKTLSSHISSLGKLRLKTEDDNLVKGIELVINQLQIAHSRVKNKSAPVSVEKSNFQAAHSLVSYCRQMIGTKKAEWQVLAERNGWGPK